MARPLTTSQRRFFLDLSDPVFDGVLDFAGAVYPEVPIGRALRELLLLAVAQNPDAALRGAAFREALQAAKRIAFEECGRSLTAAAERLGVEIATASMFEGGNG